MSDEAVQARVAGRQAKAARTAWQLSVGPLQIRCIRDGADGCHAEVRGEKGWQKMGPQVRSPLVLLQVISQFDAVANALRETTK